MHELLSRRMLLYHMTWPEIVLIVVIIAVTAGAVIVWRKRE
jgi:hypothetical protein